MREYGCNKTLRQPQQELMDAVFNDFNAGHKRTLTIAPTGLGKSGAMGGIAKHYLTLDPNAVVLVLSHLGLLIKQSGSSFMEFWDLETDVLQAQNFPYASSRCILSTVQSASIEKKINYVKRRLPWGRKVKLILLDEAHRNSGVAQVDRIIYEFFPDAHVVGFTGSPFRQNKDMTGLFDTTSYSVSLGEAIDMRYLVPPVMHGMEVDKGDLEDVMEKVLEIIMASHSMDKSIVFMRTIEDARLMAQVLRDTGFNATVITSDVHPDLRDEYLLKFKNNTADSHQIFVTVDVLSVGFDAPHLKAIIMPYGTNSVSQYLQRVGRGLRTCPEIMKRFCDIYIGGADPVIAKEKWERVHEIAARAGEDGQVNDITMEELDEILEKEAIVDDTEQNICTTETANVVNKFKNQGVDNIVAMVGDRDFPEEFLSHLVAVDITRKVKSKAKATAKQKEIIQQRGIDASTFNKTEASVTIDAIAMKEGWTVKPKRIVPSGQFKGKEANDIPWAYKARVMKTSSKYYNAELAAFFKEK